MMLFVRTRDSKHRPLSLIRHPSSNAISACFACIMVFTWMSSSSLDPAPFDFSSPMGLWLWSMSLSQNITRARDLSMDCAIIGTLLSFICMVSTGFRIQSAPPEDLMFVLKISLTCLQAIFSSLIREEEPFAVLTTEESEGSFLCIGKDRSFASLAQVIAA